MFGGGGDPNCICIAPRHHWNIIKTTVSLHATLKQIKRITRKCPFLSADTTVNEEKQDLVKRRRGWETNHPDLELTSSSMETLLFGSVSALRLISTVSLAAAAAQTIKSFFAEWYFPQVRLKLQWKSRWRLNLREDVLRWGRADEDGEVSVDILEAAVLRERIIHKREEKGGKKRNTDALN